MAWPEPARPGEPADSSRPWHWVARLEDGRRTPLPIGWNSAMRQWMVWDGSAVGPEEAVRRFAYLGPCMTPAELKAAIEEAGSATGQPQREPRGLDALVASPTPPPPPTLMLRKDAIRNQLLIFAGTLFGTLFLAEWIIGPK